MIGYQFDQLGIFILAYHFIQRANRNATVKQVSQGFDQSLIFAEKAGGTQPLFFQDATDRFIDGFQLLGRELPGWSIRVHILFAFADDWGRYAGAYARLEPGGASARASSMVKSGSAGQSTWRAAAGAGAPAGSAAGASSASPSASPL